LALDGALTVTMGWGDRTPQGRDVPDRHGQRTPRSHERHSAERTLIGPEKAHHWTRRGAWRPCLCTSRPAQRAIPSSAQSNRSLVFW